MLLRFCICFVIVLLYAFSLLTLFLLFHNLFCIIVLLVKHVHHFDRKKLLVFFTNLSVMEFQVRYLALFLVVSVIDGFEWFWMESLHRNIQLILEFLKAPLLVLHFSYYTLMTFLTMLSVILLSMLMILLSILSVIRHLICGNNYDPRYTVDWGKKWPVDVNTGKTQLVSFDDDDELFLWYGCRRKAFSLISSRDQCQTSSPSGISDTTRAGFEPVQNLSSGLGE